MNSKPGRYGIERAFALSWLNPGYWITLARLRPAHTQVRFDGSALHFASYPFEPASVFPAGRVEKDAIAEVNLGYPSEVRLKNGDILFVPDSGKEALIGFVNHNDAPLERRSRVWSALLDPFLDTWEEQEAIDRQFEWFAALGLPRAAVDAWRREVATAMVAYNFGTRLWEWVNLDLHDVLLAQRARLGRRQFAGFYSRAIGLAALDPIAPPWRSSAGNDLSGALYSVLLDWYPQEDGRPPRDPLKQWTARNEKIEALRQTLAAELSSAYSEPHRHYHTAAHIDKCLEELAGVWNYAVRLNEVRWALLFHDAVYDPRRHDNEARSADWACRVMDELKRPEDEKARIRAMILATTHSAEPRTADEALLLDIDLSTLGADGPEFDEYDQSIRAEYSWLSEDAYRQGRTKVLESFLRREHIYHTAAFRRLCERPARTNVERALAQLRP